MDERYLTSFEDQTAALGYTSGDTTLVSPQVSLIGADEVVYSKEIPHEKKIRFIKDEETGKLYFVVDERYLTFTAEEDNSSIGLAKLSTNQTLEYSTDTTIWNTFDTTSNISLNNGDKVYVRGVLNDNNTSSNYTQFKMTGKIAANGNCNALWNKDDLNAPLKKYCGYHIFKDCASLTKAPSLPATELSMSCYGYMFEGCSSLTTAPDLPATTLASYCYESMFNSCSSLTTAPSLPADTLAYWCYYEMFYNCTSLTTAPEILPATTLYADCYSRMFERCSSLTTAPVLPAKTLVYYCYSNMFYGCNSLTTAPSLPATVLAEGCYEGMFAYCTSLTTAPNLPAEWLAEKCYRQMFYGCTSLTTAPDLPATTLESYCYEEMFSDCTKLNYIKCLATYIIPLQYTSYWVYGVASTGTFVKHPDMTDWTIGIDGIPEGWTVVDAEL